MGGFEWGLWIFLVIWGTRFCGMDGGCKKIFTDQEISVLVQLYSQVMQLKHFAAEKQTKKHPKKKKALLSKMHFCTKSEYTKVNISLLF